MKMNIITRLVLTLYLLIIIGIAGFILVCAWGIVPLQYTLYWLDQLYANGNIIIVVSIVGVVLLLLSLFFIFSGIRSKRENTALLKKTEEGSINVSLQAIEEIAARYINDIKEIRDLRTKAKNADRAVDLSIKLSVVPGTVIPEVTVSLQNGLKEHIELYSGIMVRHIKILVDNTLQVNKSRVD